MADFDPKNEFLAPIGVFASRLLGADIEPARERAAHTQALLVACDKYLPVDPALEPEARKKAKNDFLFQQIVRNPAEVKQTLAALMLDPEGVDAEIAAARAIVDAGQGVPNVPPFGMILSKHLPRDTINLCLQTQAGLRIMAVNNDWPGVEKIVPARVFDNDPQELKDVQNVLNGALADPANKNEYTKQSARSAGLSAIALAANGFAASGHAAAADTLANYLGSELRAVDLFAENDLFGKTSPSTLPRPGLNASL